MRRSTVIFTMIALTALILGHADASAPSDRIQSVAPHLPLFPQAQLRPDATPVPRLQRLACENVGGSCADANHPCCLGAICTDRSQAYGANRPIWICMPSPRQ